MFEIFENWFDENFDASEITKTSTFTALPNSFSTNHRHLPRETPGAFKSQGSSLIPGDFRPQVESTFSSTTACDRAPKTCATASVFDDNINFAQHHRV